MQHDSLTDSVPRPTKPEQQRGLASGAATSIDLSSIAAGLWPDVLAAAYANPPTLGHAHEAVNRRTKELGVARLAVPALRWAAKVRASLGPSFGDALRAAPLEIRQAIVDRHRRHAEAAITAAIEAVVREEAEIRNATDSDSRSRALMAAYGRMTVGVHEITRHRERARYETMKARTESTATSPRLQPERAIVHQRFNGGPGRARHAIASGDDDASGDAGGDDPDHVHPVEIRHTPPPLVQLDRRLQAHFARHALESLLAESHGSRRAPERPA